MKVVHLCFVLVVLDPCWCRVVSIAVFAETLVR